VERLLPAAGSLRGAIRVRARQPDTLVAGVAAEVDDDAGGGVLDRNDVGWTEKED